MNATMKDIARVAKVSKSTVSRALANDPRVREVTREKILRIARDLNYRPHTLAQALALKRTNLIGVMIPKAPRSIADPFFLEFLGGIGEKAAQNGFGLILPPFRDNASPDFQDIFTSNSIDGVILTEPELEDARIDYLRKQGIPFVFQGNPQKEADDIFWVDADNMAGAKAAVNYLISLGHQRIVFIGGEGRLVSGSLRFQGYKAAMVEHRVEIDEELLVEGAFTEESGFRSVQKLLQKQVEFTAIFAANDLMAIGAMKALKEKGINIPQNVSVVGFDGTTVCNYVEPSLTTIQLPIARLGNLAAELLINRLKGKAGGKNKIMLPTRLIKRGSARPLA